MLIEPSSSKTSNISEARIVGILNKNANLDLIYKPMNNNNTEISYLKELGNFNLLLKFIF